MLLAELLNDALSVEDGRGLSERLGDITDLDISGLTADSRVVGPGDLFFALDGAKTDGAQFIPQAIEAGAAAVITHHGGVPERVMPVPIIPVENARLVLARMAARLYPTQPQVMVAVTGTSGKTSVASFTRQIWESLGEQAASIGTTGVTAPGLSTDGSLTTPDPVALHQLLDQLASGGVTHGVMEASSHGLDQFRLDGVRLQAAGFTNLGRDHLDYHPDTKSYLAAKMRLFQELLPEGAPAIVFADDAWSEAAAKVARDAKRTIMSVGRKGEFIRLKRLELAQYRQIAEIEHGGEIYRVEFPLAGDFQLSNGLVAASLAIATGSEPRLVFKALEKLKGASGRLELVGHSKDRAPCYVDYAHKPEALENVLKAVRPFATGRVICVFGCGGDRDAGKRPIMGKIAGRLADLVIVTDDNPRSEDPAAIRAAIMAAVPEAIEIGDRRKAIERAVSMLSKGDCLIVAGKGHETGQTVGGITHPFSDQAVLRAAIDQSKVAG